MPLREAVIVSTARTPIGRAYRHLFNNSQSPPVSGHDVVLAGCDENVSAGRSRSRGRSGSHSRCPGDGQSR